MHCLWLFRDSEVTAALSLEAVVKYKITCLMLTGRGISDEVAEALYQMAVGMYRDDSRKRFFRTKICEGVMRTEFQTAVLGTFGGIKFEAEIESERAKTKIRFLVDSFDAGRDESYEWVREEFPDDDAAAEAAAPQWN